MEVDNNNVINIMHASSLKFVRKYYLNLNFSDHQLNIAGFFALLTRKQRLHFLEFGKTNQVVLTNGLTRQKTHQINWGLGI